MYCVDSSVVLNHSPKKRISVLLLRSVVWKVADDLEEQHQCSHREVIEVSNTVSDLLTHRKDSGSFLKSYYLLTYACSAEGQEILTKHRDCLKSEKIGEMTLSAGTYLSEKFLEHDDDEEACANLNMKLQEYIRAMSNLCSKHEAAQLMCKSLTNMFKGLHVDKLEKCVLDCKIPEEETEEENKACLHSKFRIKIASASFCGKHLHGFHPGYFVYGIKPS
ncbi:hypothetical protein NECAME_00129 [Necator americanus]|uniref:Uncharacterized protein n=1 Tax=Necator americanus TaxID=51031 RepID=W2TYZ3_NECAM|nr:hypothetical protein NECAME_00129 [Necator americanus]ETN87270.1 hypothetical protein NECAME_00129 [Necator americanus]